MRTRSPKTAGRLRAMTIALALLSIAGGLRVAGAQQRPREERALDGVVITLKQESRCGCTNCGCPTYNLRIDGNGSVSYEGVSEVQIIGKFSYSIGRERVRTLVDEFYRADYFSLDNEYRSELLENGMTRAFTHGKPVTTSITIDGKTKTVYDFHGAPPKLRELEVKIYELSEIEPYAAFRPTPSSNAKP